MTVKIYEIYIYLYIPPNTHADAPDVLNMYPLKKKGHMRVEEDKSLANK